MTRLTSTFLSPITATLLIATMLGGCAGGDKLHQEWVDTANTNWQAVKTAQALVMAKQKFGTGDLDLAEKKARIALSEDPQNARLLMLLGQIELERGRLERSYQNFSFAIEQDENLAQAYYLRGIVLQRIHKIDLAYSNYAKAWELESDNASYLLAAGEMLVSLDRIDEAIDLLISQLDYFDANARLPMELAHIYAMSQRFDKAEKFFKKAVLLDPDNLRPREELASVQLAAGRTFEAARTLRLLLKEPSMEDRADLHRNLASAYVKLNRHSDARTHYLKVARSEAGRSDDWVMLGQLALRADKMFDALYASRKAIEMDGMNPQSYLLCGMVWQKKQRLDEALQMFDRAAELSPDDASPLIMRGLSLQQAGRQVAAGEAYRQALERSPQDSRIQQLLNSLNSHTAAGS